MSGRNKKIIKKYKGNVDSAREVFMRDSKWKEKKGYYPTSENWVAGSHSIGSFLIALLLCFVFIGFVIFVYLLVIKPAGTLTVTYTLQEARFTQVMVEQNNCPQCAVTVKGTANKCRTCGNYT
ncbi:MAG: hypothetical protein ACI8XG_000956 [Congregibacter sp.]|jgi:hypothetical protein